MAHLQPERTGVTRVKELEEIVKKLEQENKQLLTKIQDDPHTSKSLNEINITGTANGQIEDDDDLENSLVNLEPEEGLEDEWLFVSPKLPPTPAQKKITPVRWLLEGGAQREENNELPSIDDVRKTLTYNINEAENLTSYMGSSSAYSPGSTSPRSRSPTNKTAQRYLNQVRQRRLSPPSRQHEAHQHDLSPSASPLTRARHNMKYPLQRGDNGSAPVVKWKARQPPSEEEPEEEEELVPRVNWRVKQVPSAASTNDVPKVRWNRSMAAAGSDEDNESEEGLEAEDESVPVVKWKARVPPSNGGSSSSPKNRLLARPVAKKPPPVNDQGVPVVKWKAKLPANEASDEDVPIVRQPSKNAPPSNNQDVPVVRWKAKLPANEAGDEDVPVVRRQLKNTPPANNQDVPVVKWKAKLPPAESNEDVPVIRHSSRNTPPTNNADVPVVKWKAKVPANEGAGEDIPVIKRSPVSSNTSAQQRRGLIAPKRGGLTPPTMNGDSDQSSESELKQHSSENLSVSRYASHQSGGLQRPRSGSARSPSGLQYNSSGRARITSPGSNSGHSQGGGSGNSSSQEDIRSVSSSNSTGTRLKIPRKQPLQGDEHSSPREPRRHSSGLPQSSSRGGNLKPQRSTPPSSQGGGHKLGGGRTSLGNSRSAPSQVQSPRGGGGAQRHLTPPSHGSTNPRRTLPTPPSAGKSGGPRQGQRLKPARSTSPRRSQLPPPEAQVQDGGDNDNWLEGCF